MVRIGLSGKITAVKKMTSRKAISSLRKMGLTRKKKTIYISDNIPIEPTEYLTVKKALGMKVCQDNKKRHGKKLINPLTGRMIRKRQAIKKCKKLSEKGRLSVLESEVEQLKMMLFRAEEMLKLGLTSEDQQQIANAQENIEEINEKITDKENDMSILQAETGNEEPETPGDMDNLQADTGKDNDMSNLQAETDKDNDMSNLQAETDKDNDMSNLQAETDKDMSNLQAETGKEEPEAPGDMGNLQAETGNDNDMSNLQVETGKDNDMSNLQVETGNEEPEAPGDMDNLQEERGSLMTMEIDDMIQNMDNVLENIQAGIRK
jgi:hypothetical protein